MRSSPVASTSVRSATADSDSTVNVGPVSPPHAAIRTAAVRRIAPPRPRSRSGITKKLGICALNGRCSVVLGFGAAAFDHAVLCEPALGVNRRHTARSRCRDGLPVHVVLGISTRKDPRDAGVGRVALRFDVTLRIHLQPTLEHLRVGLMTDCNKERLDRELRVLACLHVANTTPSTSSPPSTSTTCEFQTNSIFSLAKARSCIILDARSSSLRCTTYTLEANRVRKSASSIAVSPPPTMTTSSSRKNAPSQVAHADTPRPSRRRSFSSPRYLADAPVEMITV